MTNTARPTPALFGPMIRVALAILLLTVVGVSSSLAADPTRTQTVDIPAGDAAGALKEFTAQTGQQLLFSVAAVEGVKTRAVAGQMSSQQALQRLLDGTGLVGDLDEKTGAFAIRRETEAEAKNAPRAAAPTADRPSSSAQTDDEARKAIPLEEFVVKDSKPFMGSDIDIPRSPDDIQPYYEWNSGRIENSGAVDVQDFFQREVPMDTNKASLSQTPNVAFTTSNISLGGLSGNSGSTTGTQNTLILLNGLPLPYFAEFGNVQEPNLNGIPLAAIDHIEVLPASDSAIYGPSAAAGVVNVVLKHDYSGTELSWRYANPVSGRAPIQNLSLTLGESLEHGKTNVLFAASYQTEQPLLVQDRLSQIVGPNQARYFGGFPGGELAYVGITAGTGFLGQPIVTSANKTPLFAGSTATTVQVPVGYQGGQGLSPLQANIGNYNLAHPNTQTDSGILGLQLPLTAESAQKSFELAINRQMTDWLQVYGQFMYASNPLLAVFDNGALFSGITELASNPGNPFGQNVKVFGTENAGYPLVRANTISRHFSGGAKIDLPFDWKANLNYTWGGSDFVEYSEGLDSSALQAAVTAGNVNLITDLSRFPVNALAYYEVGDLVGYSSVDALQLKAAGPLMKLWAGAPSLALGVEHLKNGNSYSKFQESFPADAAVGSEVIYVPGASESDNSGYAELTVPIVSKANSLFGVRQLDIQAAGRYDSLRERTTSPADTIVEAGPTGAVIFTSPNLLNGTLEPFTPASTTYHATDGTIGFKYKPVDDVAFRASYSTAFVPPTFSELLVPVSIGTQTETAGFFPGVPTTSPWGYVAVTDPQLNATYDVPVKSGGNPNLQPETAHSIDWGVIIEPTFLSGLRVSLDYTKITKYNDIIVPTAASLIANAAQFPGRVTRGTPNSGQSVGPIVLIDDTNLNAVETWTSYYNLEADYTLRTDSAGTWKLSAMANSWQHYDIQSVIGGAAVEQLGNPYVTPAGVGAGLAKFKGDLGLDWKKGPFSAGWLARYVGPYNAGALFGLGGANAYEEGTVNGWVSGQIYHDIYLGFKVGKAAGSASWWRTALSGTSVQVGVKNVFNRVPPYDGAGGIAGEWYSLYGDDWLAAYYLRVTKSF
jgi:iron complex outermembrane receptor protein